MTRHGKVLRIDDGDDEQRVTVRFDDGTVTIVGASTMFTIEPGSGFTANGFSDHHWIFHWETRRPRLSEESLTDG